jgi:signal transduction histidine kinase
LIASLVQALTPGLVAKGVSVEFGAPAQLPLVQADAAHLRQALEELIVNAAEAMAEGGRITITASAAGNGVPRVRLGVADTGPGVPAELGERIFQLFMTTKRRGTGVGLAVVRKIVERHGGTIMLEANEPGGARFVLDLPTVQDATS